MNAQCKNHLPNPRAESGTDSFRSPEVLRDPQKERAGGNCCVEHDNSEPFLKALSQALVKNGAAPSTDTPVTLLAPCQPVASWSPVQPGTCSHIPALASSKPRGQPRQPLPTSVLCVWHTYCYLPPSDSAEYPPRPLPQHSRDGHVLLLSEADGHSLTVSRLKDRFLPGESRRGATRKALFPNKDTVPRC